MPCKSCIRRNCDVWRGKSDLKGAYVDGINSKLNGTEPEGKTSPCGVILRDGEGY